MVNYKVVLEIELDADSPLEAAKELVKWIKERDELQYYVQNTETNELFSVDLAEEDDDAVLPCKEYDPLINLK